MLQTYANYRLRYIDQCQELLDTYNSRGERKDWEVYSLAVRTAGGQNQDSQPEVPREYVAYVDHTLQYLSPATGRKDSTTGHPGPTFNYERWLSSTWQV